MKNIKQPTRFAPMLYMTNVKEAMDFYQKAFGASIIRHFDNDDGSVHVAEMEIDGNVFHLHDEVKRMSEFGPNNLNGTTVVIGLYTDDVDGMTASAEKAGAIVTEAPKDYEYGMRQAYLTDPFGHHWQLQKNI